MLAEPMNIFREGGAGVRGGCGGRGSTLWEGAHCPHQHSDVHAKFSILWLHVLWNCQLPASISKIETMSQKLFQKKPGDMWQKLKYTVSACNCLALAGSCGPTAAQLQCIQSISCVKNNQTTGKLNRVTTTRLAAEMTLGSPRPQLIGQQTGQLRGRQVKKRKVHAVRRVSREALNRDMTSQSAPLLTHEGLADTVNTERHSHKECMICYCTRHTCRVVVFCACRMFTVTQAPGQQQQQRQ